VLREVFDDAQQWEQRVPLGLRATALQCLQRATHRHGGVGLDGVLAKDCVGSNG
jgi:hypothetical protein